MSEKKLPPRTSVTLSEDLDTRLDQLAEQQNTTKRNILRKAFALYDVAAAAKARGDRFGIVDQNNKLVTEISGI